MDRDPTINSNNVHTRDDRFVATSYPEPKVAPPLHPPAPEISADGLNTPIASDNDSAEMSRTEEVANQVKDKAGEVMSTVQERMGEVGERARVAGGRFIDSCDSAMTATGSRLEEVAESLRNRPEDSPTGRIAVRAGDMLASSGSYLQQSRPEDVRLDLENAMRKRPLTTLAIGAGFGFLLARALRRS